MNKQEKEGGGKMEKLLSTGDAAKVLNCQPQTLNRWRHEGKGPRYFKVGRLVRYSEDELKQWVDNNSHQNTIYKMN